MPHNPHDQLLRSWDANAAAWTEAVREGMIPSRRAGTDAAIVEAVLERHPRSVLDVGCGEGWLARALASHGIEVVGVDASAALVERAREQGGGTFHVCSYEDLATIHMGAAFDAAVCNFSLLDDEIYPVIEAVRSKLDQEGVLVIQTVHPWTARGDEAYRDGWRTETFSGMGAGFTEPMPWYFRTLESWVRVLQRSGFRIADLREPIHPESGEPLSLLLVSVAT